MEEKEQQGSRTGTFLRLGALTLALVLIWQILAPSLLDYANAKALTRQETTPTTEPQLLTAQEYFDQATACIQNGSYADALPLLEQAIDLAEDEALLSRLWLTTASVYILTGDTAAAEKALNTCLEADDGQTDALLLRAQLAIENGKTADAIGDVEAYLTLAPEDTATRQTLAQLMESCGDYAGAAEVYGELNDREPEDASHRLNRLRCFFLCGRYEEAIAGFDEYKESIPEGEDDPFGGIADFLRAACYLQLGDYPTAEAGFRLAIQAGYDQAGCLEQITLCRFEQGDYAGVLETGGEVLALTDATLTAPELLHQRMGIAAMYLGDYQAGLDSLEQAEELSPGLEGNAYYRGICLLSLQRLEEAAQAFDQALAEGFLTQLCYYNRGVCYVNLGEYDKALSDMDKAVELAEDADVTGAAQEIRTQLTEYLEQTASQSEAYDTQES